MSYLISFTLVTMKHVSFGTLLVCDWNFRILAGLFQVYRWALRIL